WDDVPGEGRTRHVAGGVGDSGEGVENRPLGAGGVERLGKIACPLDVGWQSGLIAERLGLPPSFVGEEVEQLVLLDRAADSNTPDILPRQIRSVVDGVGRRIESGIAPQ